MAQLYVAREAGGSADRPAAATATLSLFDALKPTMTALQQGGVMPAAHSGSWDGDRDRGHSHGATSAEAFVLRGGRESSDSGGAVGADALWTLSLPVKASPTSATLQVVALTRTKWLLVARGAISVAEAVATAVAIAATDAAAHGGDGLWLG